MTNSFNKSKHGSARAIYVERSTKNYSKRLLRKLNLIIHRDMANFLTHSKNTAKRGDFAEGRWHEMFWKTGQF